MTTMIRAEEQCSKPPVGESGLPEQPMEMNCGTSGAFLDQLIQYTTYFCVALAFASGCLLMAMVVLDRNRGEAGIASSDQSRVGKWAFGCFVISCAFVLARGVFFVAGDIGR